MIRQRFAEGEEPKYQPVNKDGSDVSSFDIEDPHIDKDHSNLINKPEEPTNSRKLFKISLFFLFFIGIFFGILYIFFPNNTHIDPAVTTPDLKIIPDRRLQFLSKTLKINKFSVSYTLAEQIDRLFLVEPYYEFSNVPKIRNHHENFVSRFLNQGVSIIVIEGLLHNEKTHLMSRQHENYHYETIEIEMPMYIRENLLNVAVKKHLEQVKDNFILWIDAHQINNNLFWFEEYIYKLSRYNAVQGFQHLMQFDWRNSTFNNQIGISYWSRFTKTNEFSKYSMDVKFGDSWGITTDFYQQMGYLLDEAVCMCADCFFTYSILSHNNEELDKSFVHFDSSSSHYVPDYEENFIPWMQKAIAINKGRVGVVRGQQYHLPHEHSGKYFKMLKDCNKGHFNIEKDLVRNQDTFLLSIPKSSKWWSYFKNLFSRD